jgi:hypothetical protein
MINYYRYVPFIILFAVMAVNAEDLFISQGSNQDRDPQAVGEMPYEMKDRKEPRVPFVTFDDCTEWRVESAGAVAFLNRSSDQRMFNRYSAELTYLATEAESTMTLRPDDPVKIPQPWDSLSIWIYGNSWQYGDVVGPLDMDILLLDADGKESAHRVPSYHLGTINYKHWWYLKIKVHRHLESPVKLAGFRFSGKKITYPGKTETIYLGPMYAYKENLGEINFQKFPQELPFPVGENGILPVNKCGSYENTTQLNSGRCEFTYHGRDAALTYIVDTKQPELDAISVLWNGKSIKPCADGMAAPAGENQWKHIASELSNNVLTTEWNVSNGSANKSVWYRYYIRQKSLVLEIEEDDSSPGIFSEIKLGRARDVSVPKLFRVPMLNFDYAQAPRMLYADGLFFFSQFDWYYSQASLLYAKEFPVTENSAVYNGGARYIPKTDGTRNCVRERLYINVSPDVQEVLPTIANPASPMKPIMGDKAWMTINCVGMTHQDRLRIPRRYRNMGIENVAVRYHEGTWRDGGESFTFRSDASPYQGGNEALRDMVSEVKSLGWLCGLYTNYTDFTPANPTWNEDWLRLDQNGDWVSSWYGCYSVKPMIAWQEQMKYAPLIHKKYGTNHCYCDVHTAIPPFARVDYDARVPGAATFRRTFEIYGMILMRERMAHKGPVYSEGGNHWWYAGLVDGNYANAFPSLEEQLLFVDFELLKIHPLEMDAGASHYVFDPETKKAGSYVPLTLAYGHICQLTPYNLVESMQRYFLIQPLQKYYAMVPVKNIQYWNGTGFVDSSEALVSDSIQKRKVFVEYKNGCKIWVNAGQDDWNIEVGGDEFILPHNGFYACYPPEGIKSFSILTQDINSETVQVDFAKGPDSIYIDTRGGNVNLEGLSGSGNAVLKKEKSGWQLIPVEGFDAIGFDPNLIYPDQKEITVEVLDENGMPKGLAKTELRDGKVWISRKPAEEFKYRITPSLKNLIE